MITTFLLIGLVSFLLRWFVNWIYLDNKYGSVFKGMNHFYSVSEVILILKRIAFSEWNLWWIGNDFRVFKVISNIFSIILYLCIILTIVLILLG